MIQPIRDGQEILLATQPGPPVPGPSPQPDPANPPQPEPAPPPPEPMPSYEDPPPVKPIARR